MKIENYNYLGQQMDVSGEFYSIGNTYFNVKCLADFDEETLTGRLVFGRYERKGRMAFNMYTCPFEESPSWAFPPAYGDEPSYPIRFSFTADNVVRMVTSYSNQPLEDKESVMIQRLSNYRNYETEPMEGGVMLKTPKLLVEIRFSPFAVIVKDETGRLLTRSLNQEGGKCLLNCNPLPFSYVRTLDDMRKYGAASFLISPGERFYGCGESFTRFDKSGQKMVLWAKDAHGVETPDMYKPVPFYISSRGYGLFAHTGAAVTFDLGCNYQEAQTIFIGDEEVDLFIIAGKPKEILASYTELTGKAAVPPLWSFGLWMSRISYNCEAQVREVAKNLRKEDVPCDVIHLDTGWFECDWQCDYEFSKKRFGDPRAMIRDLKEEGYHLCLWQLPYFTPQNRYFKELFDRGLAVVNGDGRLPTDDAILDFTNPAAIRWYQEKLRGLLQMGIEAVKVDFGEAGPLEGVYHNGRSGRLEHNLYPLRYTAAAEGALREETGESVVWARSAWAGSQRHPLHWGGDSENTNMGMLCSLRGGLSLGMCGFTFWSHDAGGFVEKSPEELYGRWMFLAIFSSHIRCHGKPPKEPWLYSPQFLDLFRRQVKLRYRLLPYIYAQALKSASLGWPMLRAMCLEFPEDENCLSLEDQYLFGDDILVAPLFEEHAQGRRVYLPVGTWLDLLKPEMRHEGGRWLWILKGELEGIALVREGAVIPMVEAAPCTRDIKWDTLTYRWFTLDENEGRCFGTGVEPFEKRWFSIDRAGLLKLRKGATV